MRRPLRYQIMLPMAGVMLLSVSIVAALGAAMAVRATEQRIAAQHTSVIQILEESNFPLTNTVLRQMHALSGAEYILVGGDGQVLATSGSAKRFIDSLSSRQSSVPERVAIGDRVWVRNKGHLHAIVPLAERRGAGRDAELHLYFPEDDYRRAWQRAMYPSLAFAALGLPLVMLLASITARQISGRMNQLQSQVEQISRGDFQQLTLSDRDDEIRALGQCVNRMAGMLASYEVEVRRTERMRTLAMLGGGIAHHLRNLATGCNLALDLHAGECHETGKGESLDVAKRQLRLMEDYLQRFLQLGKPVADSPHETVDLVKLIDDLLPLVRPAAKHAEIEIDWKFAPAAGPNTVVGNSEQLGLLVMNLLVNAIEAASQGKLLTDGAGQVRIELESPSPDRMVIAVSDTGPGPSDDVQSRLFEPFVTGRPDGVGLGLAVARDVVQRLGGEIHWMRIGKMTRFLAEIPRHQPEMQRA